MQRAQRWWKSQKGSDGPGQSPKVYRRKAAEWCLHVDMALRSLTTKGLSHFVPPADLSDDRLEFTPLLGIALDQGPDGWSGIWFLIFSVGACILPINDISHRVWNDTKLALKDAGLWGVAKLLIIMLNWDHGPWKDAAWLEKTGSPSESTPTF